MKVIEPLMALSLEAKQQVLAILDRLPTPPAGGGCLRVQLEFHYDAVGHLNVIQGSKQEDFRFQAINGEFS